MGKKILIATVKPFAKKAVQSIIEIANLKGYDVSLLESYKDENELKEAVKDVDALIIRSDKVHRGIIENADNLRIVVRAGAGYDNVDLEAASKKNIVVMNTPGQNSNAVAELAIGMMIFLVRNKFNGKAGTELKGKSLGIHAYGHVGKYVAEIAAGFGMDIYAFDPYIPIEDIKKDGLTPVNSVKELYSKCQYVSIHIPANEETKNSINFDLLKLMPQKGVLVNTARKEVICEDSLKKMFAERQDFKYISDIAPDCAEILKEKYQERCFFTPKKMGAQTAEANINAGIAAVNQIISFIENGDTKFQVNK